VCVCVCVCVRACVCACVCFRQRRTFFLCFSLARSLARKRLDHNAPKQGHDTYPWSPPTAQQAPTTMTVATCSRRPGPVVVGRVVVVSSGKTPRAMVEGITRRGAHHMARTRRRSDLLARESGPSHLMRRPRRHGHRNPSATETPGFSHQLIFPHCQVSLMSLDVQDQIRQRLAPYDTPTDYLAGWLTD
jgi:hypothetical protein